VCLPHGQLNRPSASHALGTLVVLVSTAPSRFHPRLPRDRRKARCQTRALALAPPPPRPHRSVCLAMVEIYGAALLGSADVLDAGGWALLHLCSSQVRQVRQVPVRFCVDLDTVQQHEPAGAMHARARRRARTHTHARARTNTNT
jgi:hypothetical protein